MWTRIKRDFSCKYLYKEDFVWQWLR